MERYYRGIGNLLYIRIMNKDKVQDACIYLFSVIFVDKRERSYKRSPEIPFFVSFCSVFLFVCNPLVQKM